MDEEKPWVGARVAVRRMMHTYDGKAVPTIARHENPADSYRVTWRTFSGHNLLTSATSAEEKAALAGGFIKESDQLFFIAGDETPVVDRNAHHERTIFPPSWDREEDGT